MADCFYGLFDFVSGGVSYFLKREDALKIIADLREAYDTGRYKTGVKCGCGGENTIWITGPRYLTFVNSTGMEMKISNGMIACNDCGATWWD